MKQFINIRTIIFSSLAALMFTSCGAGDNHPGWDFMPDMGHSIAYDANHEVYYQNNTWGGKEEYKKFNQPRTSVEGTVPRGYAGYDEKNASEYLKFQKDMEGKPMNGSVPYYYGDSDEARALATAGITQNPFPISKKGIAEGKELWGVYCTVCHGDKLDGNGPIVENGAYPAQPPNFLNDDFKASSDGRYYHAIMQGKGVMGHYKDKLSYEERWNVIHYIRAQQDAGYAADAIDANQKDFSTALNGTDSIIALDNVYFRTGSSFLAKKSSYELDALARALTGKFSNLQLEIGGHTDNTGSSAGNVTLSQARATAVLDFLVSRGVSASRLSAVGYGSVSPRASNGTEEGRAKNRRTEIKIK